MRVMRTVLAAGVCIAAVVWSRQPRSVLEALGLIRFGGRFDYAA